MAISEIVTVIACIIWIGLVLYILLAGEKIK